MSRDHLADLSRTLGLVYIFTLGDEAAFYGSLIVVFLYFCIFVRAGGVHLWCQL